jgi:cytochrome c oxidase subunit III
MASHVGVLPHHFQDRRQQLEASTLAMWMFLATEVLFFGTMFTAYTVYRSEFPEEFSRASKHLKTMAGAINTAVLICSSLTMALAVFAAHTSRRRLLIGCLIATLTFGAVFLSIKAWEWYAEYQESLVPGLRFNTAEWTQADASGGPVDPYRVQIFFVFYFVLTGLHAFHMIVGLALLLLLLYFSIRGHYSAEYYMPVEVIGLYWHFVDVVWIFILPLLYLVRN